MVAATLLLSEAPDGAEVLPACNCVNSACIWSVSPPPPLVEDAPPPSALCKLANQSASFFPPLMLDELLDWVGE